MNVIKISGSSVDYTRLSSAAEIEKAARAEFRRIQAAHQTALGGVENFVALRREEARERAWAQQHD